MAPLPPNDRASLRQPDFGNAFADINELPLHDSLTRLKNRQWLEENLPQILEEDSGEVGLLFVDLDGLGAVNNTQGHEAGNNLIQTAANTLGSTLRIPVVSAEFPDRPYDVFRCGGDEFTVIIRGVRAKRDMTAIADRVSSALSEAGASASVGATLYEDGESVNDFLTRGSIAMQQIKQERKLHKYPNETQRVAARQIGAIAAEHGLDLKDIPTLLTALRSS